MGISSALVARLYGEIVITDRACGREAKQHAHDAALASEKEALKAKETQIATSTFFEGVSVVTSVAGGALEKVAGPIREAEEGLSTFEKLSSGRCDPKKPAADEARKAQETHARVAESAEDGAAAEGGSQQAREEVSAMLRNLQSKA
jgi:hypothetical protein